MISASVGTYGGGSASLLLTDGSALLLLTDGSDSLLLTDGSRLFASSVSFFSDFFLVRATSCRSSVIKSFWRLICSFWRLICSRKSSVCRSRRSIFSESDNGSAAAALKARQQAPTRALPLKLRL